MYPKHDEDFYGWAMAEASLLRQHKWNELDIEHLAEELESMGASERREFISRMAQLIFHLLKWHHQPDFREFNKRSWEASIQEQRKKVKKLIVDNPSFKPNMEDFVVDSYEDSILLIKKETPIDLKLLPAQCPYTFDQIMNDEFYPE
ncbi:MAG: DUF29 domain-containing protein [Candidatus Rhabdochlamydia sp.]